MRFVLWLLGLAGIRRQFGGKAVSIRPAGDTDDPVRACQRRLKQAQANVLVIKADSTSDPLTRRILLAKSNLINLELAQNEDHQTS